VGFLVGFTVFSSGRFEKNGYFLGWVQLHQPWR